MKAELLQRLKLHLEKTPQINSSAYLASGAHIIGDVCLGPLVSIWPAAVLRGDINAIVVGEGSNIQDGAVVHLADDYPVLIGQYVTIGHSAVVHACTIEDECLIGMNATILDGAVIGRQSIVGAGALVRPGMIVPEGSMVMGVPGKIVRSLTVEERERIRLWADRYVVLSRYYQSITRSL
jgi:carbonic anhydrase/acetyltransferase-like protein (isoleucine patch superfamily)